MKSKIALGLFFVFIGALLLWGINVALGVCLVALGCCALVDSLTHRCELTAIEGTFRATVEGSDPVKVERELALALKSWQTNHQ